MLQVPSSFISPAQPGSGASRARRRLCVAVLVAAAFYGGFRAGVMFSGLQAHGGPFEPPGRSPGDLVQTIRFEPDQRCDVRAEPDTRCRPPVPATQVPVTPAPVAQAALPQVRRRKPAPPSRPALRAARPDDETHIGMQR